MGTVRMKLLRIGNRACYFGNKVENQMITVNEKLLSNLIGQTHDDFRDGKCPNTGKYREVYLNTGEKTFFATPVNLSILIHGERT